MKPEKSKPIGIRVGNLFVLVIVMGTLLTLLAVLTGCPEAQNMMKPVITEPADTEPPAMVGDMKKPEEPETTEQEETPAEEEPADTTPPTVVEVAWYGDEQLTEALTTDSEVWSGDTIYTVVTFSEPMMHIVANDETVRPVLYIVVDGKTKRYKMLPHSADLKSGEAKPTNGDTDEYLCKYTLPANIIGTLDLRVGSATTDTAGNKVAEALVHTTPFMVTEPEPEQITLTLPPGYTLPPELIPTELTTLSANERALVEADAITGQVVNTAIHPYTTKKPADVISLLPYKDREEVYDLFVASINLPFFAEAAEKRKEQDITLRILYAEDVSAGKDFQAYVNYWAKILREIKFSVNHYRENTRFLLDIYFEENPQDAAYNVGTSSKYWILLEWYRLQLEHPRLPVPTGSLLHPKTPQGLLDLFRESARKGNIFGLDNPWD